MVSNNIHPQRNSAEGGAFFRVLIIHPSARSFCRWSRIVNRIQMFSLLTSRIIPISTFYFRRGSVFCTCLLVSNGHVYSDSIGASPAAKVCGVALFPSILTPCSKHDFQIEHDLLFFNIGKLIKDRFWSAAVSLVSHRNPMREWGSEDVRTPSLRIGFCIAVTSRRSFGSVAELERVQGTVGNCWAVGNFPRSLSTSATT